MPVKRFPDPRLLDPGAHPEGLLALGGDLHPESLNLAYSQGIFPWPIQGLPLAWFCPPERAILDFADLHLPRSLKQEQRRRNALWRFTIDEAFEQVIGLCAQTRHPGRGGEGTWITGEMRQAYVHLYRLGRAHSVEVWAEGRLIGGIYGVDAGGAFAGESMFHLEPNASKLALLHLIGHLRQAGLDWLDIQVLTPHLQALGAKVISRDSFLDRLSRTRARGLNLFPGGPRPR